MSILNILPSTICTNTEMIHEFGVRDCDRIAEQMGNGLKHLCALVAFQAVYMLGRITCSSMLSKM